MMTLDWYSSDAARRIPSVYRSGGALADMVNEHVTPETLEEFIAYVSNNTMCANPIYPVGQFMDDEMRWHYAFFVHPDDIDTFAAERQKAVWGGDLGWFEEMTRYSHVPDGLRELVSVS